MTRKQLILDTVEDLGRGFLVWDRHEDEELAIGEIEEAMAQGEITVDEIVAHFRKELE